MSGFGDLRRCGGRAVLRADGAVLVLAVRAQVRAARPHGAPLPQPLPRLASPVSDTLGNKSNQ